MKPLVMQCIGIAGLCAGLTALNVHAIPIEIPGTGQDIPKNGTGPAGGNGNSPADDFFRLQTVVSAYDLAHPGSPLPTPILAGNEPLSSANVPSPGLTGFDYAVLHYGVGNNGVQASGGGVEVFYLNGASGFNFPANGSGPNGFGGFSSIVLYEGQDQVTVPEGGMTIALLGTAFALLGVTRRYVGVSG